jgi:hypothetical protein
MTDTCAWGFIRNWYHMHISHTSNKFCFDRRKIEGKSKYSFVSVSALSGEIFVKIRIYKTTGIT